MLLYPHYYVLPFPFAAAAMNCSRRGLSLSENVMGTHWGDYFKLCSCKFVLHDAEILYAEILTKKNWRDVWLG